MMHRVLSSCSSGSLASGHRRLFRTKSRDDVTPHSSSIGRYEYVALSVRSITPVAGRSGPRRRATVSLCRLSRAPRLTSTTSKPGTCSINHTISTLSILHARFAMRTASHLISRLLSFRTERLSPGRCLPVSHPSSTSTPVSGTGRWDCGTPPSSKSLISRSIQ